ncbi:peptide-binding protein [Alicyclobacillus contaminans]|uniref:ABC transporter substrate-binding protein n=1 Tax=Alicyclobacillus contaminans TaxID=392016 RepID=UPI0003F63084|nr:ABC transporter substrate-binding protein [Alicyclobacillus contaminans]GMA49961.1 peptide-binding protein [Alicyclobacillus contaminans]
MTKKQKWLLPIATLSVTGLLLAGCGTGGNNAVGNTDNGSLNASTATPKDGGTLVVSSFSDIVTVNPLFIEDTASGDIQQLLYANVYDVDRKGNLVAEPWSLADGPLKISPDGLTYTVKLKPNAKWSDGQPVTADDLVWTINTILNPATGSVLLSNFDHVKSVKKIDEHTVQIQLKSVFAPFQYSLNFPVLPYHVLKNIAPKDLEKNPYGTDPTKTVTDGPWKWTEWNQKEYLRLDRDPNYWGPKPHIQTIMYKIYADQNTEVQALIKGDTDVNESVPIPQLNAVEARKNIDVILKPGPQYEYLAFNFQASNFPGNFDPFTGQKTRQAIAYALNCQGMLDSVLHGTGTLLNSPFLPAPVGWTGAATAGTTYNYDPAKAKQLLKEDGWTPGPDGILQKDGHRFSFTLLYNTGNSRREQIATVIQQELKDVGIDCQPKAEDFSSLVANSLNPGKFQAVLMGQNMTVDPDVSVLFSSKYFPPNGENMGWYKNAQVDKLLAEGDATLDKTQRSKIYQQVAKIMSQDLPEVFLYQYGLPFAYSSNVHWNPQWAPEPSLPYGYFYGIQTWWVDRQS